MEKRVIAAFGLLQCSEGCGLLLLRIALCDLGAPG